MFALVRKRSLVSKILIVFLMALVLSMSVVLPAQEAQASVTTIIYNAEISVISTMLVYMGVTFLNQNAMACAAAEFIATAGSAALADLSLAALVPIGGTIIISAALGFALYYFINNYLIPAINTPATAPNVSYANSDTSTFNPLLYFSEFHITVMQNSSLRNGVPFMQLWVASAWGGSNLYYNVDLTHSGNVITGLASVYQDDFDSASSNLNYCYVSLSITNAIIQYAQSLIIGNSYNTGGNVVFKNISYNSATINPGTATYSSTPTTQTGTLGASTTVNQGEVAKNDKVGGSVVVQSPAALTGETTSSIVGTLTTQTGILSDIKTGINTISGNLDMTMPLNTLPLTVDGTLLTNKFPFSLPWDLQRAVTALNVAPSFPVINATFYNPISPAHPITFPIDVSAFTVVLIPIVRSGFLLLFMIGLVFATRKLLGGAS